MTLRSVLPIVACLFLLAWSHASVSSEEVKKQRKVLSDAFGQTLREQLVKKGYTPRNAEAAASGLIDRYAHCLVNQQAEESSDEAEVTSVRLGDAVILAYRTNCLTEFLDDFADLPQ